VTELACPFCALAAERLIYHDGTVVGIWDAYPVSPGHALVVTKRHISHLFEATPVERTRLLEGAAAVKANIDRDYNPDGFNIGVNVGESGG
jgi:diadenosine tetraphosphate (Ap4A) HIT family hydrolase